MTRTARGLAIVALWGWAQGPVFASDAPAVSAPATRYFPLRLGTRWVYEIHDHAEHTREQREVLVREPSRLPDLPPDAVLVDEHQQGAPDDDWVPIVYAADHGFLTMRNDLTYREGRIAQALEGYTARRILPLQPAQGQTWQDVTYTSDAETGGDDNPTRCEWRYRVIGYETVAVPAGRFAAALRIQSTARHRFFTYQYDDWYAADVGLVRSETRKVSDGGGALVADVQLLSLQRSPTGGAPGATPADAGAPHP